MNRPIPISNSKPSNRSFMVMKATFSGENFRFFEGHAGRRDWVTNWKKYSRQYFLGIENVFGLWPATKSFLEYNSRR